jgi:hypothetical protein
MGGKNSTLLDIKKENNNNNNNKKRIKNNKSPKLWET